MAGHKFCRVMTPFILFVSQPKKQEISRALCECYVDASSFGAQRDRGYFWELFHFGFESLLRRSRR